jgi:hypothetical protein
MWHEADPARRREILSALFADGAENYTRAFHATQHQFNNKK